MAQMSPVEILVASDPSKLSRNSEKVLLYGSELKQTMQQRREPEQGVERECGWRNWLSNDTNSNHNDGDDDWH